MVIETREITDKLISGEITTINLTGNQSENNLLQRQEIEALLDNSGAAGFATWRGTWEAGNYLKDQMVNDNGWLMIANKDTAERAAPQPAGDAGWLTDDAALSPFTVSAKRLILGVRYTNTLENAYLNGFRVHTTRGNRYEIYTITDPLGDAISRFHFGFIATETGWTQVSVSPTIVPAGVTVDLVAATFEPSDTPSTFDGTWGYSTPDVLVVPGAGFALHADDRPDLIRISYSDANATDREAELDLVSAGDTITTGSMIWNVLSVTKDIPGLYFEFKVDPPTQLADGPKALVFEYREATIIDYEVEADYFLTHPTGQGLWIVDGLYEDIAVDDNCYGIDVFVQGINIPVDWDIMSVSNTLGGVTLDPQQYVFGKAVDTTIPDETFTPIVSCALINPVAGVYEYKFTISWTIDTATNSAIFRVSIDGGTTWETYSRESADATDTQAFSYFFPLDVDGSEDLSMEIEGRKENNADTMIVTFADVIIDQKR